MDKAKIISKLVLIDELNQKEIELNFKEGMNIIIGSKGGGKSTLLSILHLMHNRHKIDKRITDTLRDYRLKIAYLEYSNHERTTFELLENTGIDNSDDIIKQDDKIKTALSDINEVKKDSEEFVNELINTNAQYFIMLISKYQNTFKEISTIRNKYTLNWNLLAHFKTEDEKLTDYKHKLFDTYSEKDFDSTDLDLYVLLDTYAERLQEYKPDMYATYKDTLNEMLSTHQHDNYNKYSEYKLNNIYGDVLEQERKQLKQSNNMSVSVTSFKKDAKALFENVAVQLARNNLLFQELCSPSLSIEFNGKKKTHYGMELTISSEVFLNELEADQDVDDSWVFTILDTILYKPKKKLVEWSNWVLWSYTSQSPVKKDDITATLNKNLGNKIREHIKLLADGKDYNTMSLGTRTSFGIKQKIKKFKDPILFLDQPEDNLDNFTIFNELIKIFDDKKQFFMVTHNSNFGTLTNPQTITTCSLNKDDASKSYQQELNILSEMQIPSEDGITDSPVRHYLEGGNESLKQRYEKLSKGE